MKYNIISINDDRKAFKDNIRKYVGLGEVHYPAFNAYTQDITAGMAERGLTLHRDIWTNPKRGELGIWLSNFDCWEMVSFSDQPLVVFEDDAVIDETFREKLDRFVKEIPNDWDFAALWVPDNQRIDYNYNTIWINWKPHTYGHLSDRHSRYRIASSDLVAKVYQGYGMVSLMYSPNGGRKLIELAQEHGIRQPVDCWIYELAHMGLLNGYAPHPDFADIVTYDWSALSHVQLTERFE